MYSQGFSTLPKTEFKFEHSADVHSQPVQDSSIIVVLEGGT